MRTNVYECMFILDTNKVAGDQSGMAKQLHGLLEKNNAEVLATRPWAEQKLAYPINNHKKGLYYLTYFRTEGKNLDNLERDFQLNETILRSLVLRIDPKLVDIMLTMARDERPMVALQTVNAPPPEEDLGGEDGDRGPRRSPPRRAAAEKPDKDE